MSNEAKTEKNVVVQTLCNTIDKMGDQFQSALPPQIPVERFVRVVKTAIQNSPDLIEADRPSLFNSCLKAAADGLIPDGREAALVTFNTKAGNTWVKKVQYMPMVAGILKKVRNSGELQSLTAQVVYENDEFDYWVDEDGEHLKHRPDLLGNRGEALLVYALAKTKSGGVYIEPLPKSEIEKIRSVSRAGNGENSPWAKWWDEMAKKSAIRRLSKRLPMNTDLDDLIRADDELYAVREKDITPPSETARGARRPSRLDAIAAHAESQQPDTETGELILNGEAAPTK